MRTAQFSDYAAKGEIGERNSGSASGGLMRRPLAVTRLIYSGIFDELPVEDRRHHMGGMIPFFPEDQTRLPADFFRQAGCYPTAQDAKLKKPPVEYYKMLYADTALGEVAADTLRTCFLRYRQMRCSPPMPFRSEQGRG